MATEADFIRQFVEPDLRRRCWDWAVEYLAKRPDCIGEAEPEGRKLGDNPQHVAKTKAAEVAMALVLGKHPINDVGFGVGRPDPGWDIQAGPLRIDVKMTEHRNVGTACLFWPLNRNDVFEEKDFNVLALVRCETVKNERGEERSNGWFQIRGWISKDQFRRDMLVAGPDHNLDNGTWYVPLKLLSPVIVREMAV